MEERLTILIIGQVLRLCHIANGSYPSAWYVAFGQAEDGNGENLHGAGAVRFDKKIVGTGEGEERVLNYVRLVRKIK